MCCILPVKLNHGMTRNLPIEMIRDIVSYTYKFKHQHKFQPVLRDVKDGAIYVANSNGIWDSLWYESNWWQLSKIGSMGK